MVFAFFDTATNNTNFSNTGLINPDFADSNTIALQSGSTVNTFESSYWSTLRLSFKTMFKGSFIFSGDTPVDGTIQTLDLHFTSTSLSFASPSAGTSSAHRVLYDVQMSYPEYKSYFANDAGGYNLFMTKPAEFSYSLFRANDRIEGSTSSDTLLGFDGNDVIWGASPDATTDGGDVLLGNRGDDIIYGGAGNDSMVGGSGLVDASDGNDVLYGDNGNDDIYGSAGNDLIYGGTGNDLIVGGADNDILSGGAGNDIFVFVLGGAYDTILDFQASDIITIERTALVTDAASALSNIISDQYGSFINLGDGSGITLAGVQAADLSAADFNFYG